MKTSIKTLAFAVAALAFTACASPTLDPVRPAAVPVSIVQPVTPGQPQPIAEKLDDEQPKTSSPATLTTDVPAQYGQQPATVGNPNPQPIPRPAYQQPSRNPAKLTAVSDSLL